MASPTGSHSEVTPDKPPRWQMLITALVIVFGVMLSYGNSISAPFIFDDIRGIIHNESIRSLWPLTDALNPPKLATGAGGRPIINLSLAVNYAIGGLDVRSYHIFNMIVHALAALVLFGLVRRTLSRPVLRDRFGDVALPLSFAVSFLWALHPLLTESVTGVIQRTESMGGLFYLLTLYTFVRSIEGRDRMRWQVFCVLACLIGMATKEIMATVPVIALLYDRTFGAGTFKDAWKQRWRFYGALVSTWLLLAYLVVINESRGGMVGFGLGMSSWDYALTQCQAILMYLKLSLWPSPLVLDYGSGVVSGVGEVWLQGVILLTLVAGTFVALVRKPVVGFVAFTFFSILAPSSSFVPLTTQTMAEHRMYLPLAGVVVLVVLGLYRYVGKWVIPGAIGLAMVAGVATADRNEDYRTEVSLWKDTVNKRPDNWRAHSNLGAGYANTGKLKEALYAFEMALRLDPKNLNAAYNMGNIYLEMGRFEESEKRYRQVIGFNENYGMAYYGLANSLIRRGRTEEALVHLRHADSLSPNEPTLLHSIASSLAALGRVDEAMTRYDQLLKLTPNDLVVHREIGTMLVRAGRHAEALPYLEMMLRNNPQDTEIRYNLALVSLELERYATAANEFSRVLQAEPEFAKGHFGLGSALLGLGRWSEAARHFKEALRLRPDYEEARMSLERAEIRRDLRR